MKKLLYGIIIFTIGGGAAWYLYATNADVKSIFLYKRYEQTMNQSFPIAEHVTFRTSDNFSIIGDWYHAPGERGALLLHMMPATRESWKSVAQALQGAGISVLAIDLRGHGESSFGPNGYQQFSDDEHQLSIRDVEAGIAFLKEKGITDISLGGASIGANLAFQYMAKHHEISSAFLLSPGLNYRGIETENTAQLLSATQQVYFIGDEDDMRSSGASAAAMARRLYELTPAKKDIKLTKGAGHGTDILKANSELVQELVLWLIKEDQ